MKPGQEVSVARAVFTEQQEMGTGAKPCPRKSVAEEAQRNLTFHCRHTCSVASLGCLSQTFGFGYFPEIHRRIFLHTPFSANHKWLWAGVGLHPGVALQGPFVAQPLLLLQGQGWTGTTWKCLWGRHWASTVETHSLSCQSRVEGHKNWMEMCKFSHSSLVSKGKEVWSQL